MLRKKVLGSRIMLFTLGLSLVLFAAFAPIGATAATTGEINPGTPWYDTNGNLINAHGAGIIKVGNTYYMVGEKRTSDSFQQDIGGGWWVWETKFVGISMYSSTDLVNWTYVGDPITPQPGTTISANDIVERPKILYSNATGKYVIYMHTWNGNRIAYCTSSSLTSGYTYQGCMKNENGTEIQSGDIGTFVDTDGTSYLMMCSGVYFKLDSSLTNVVKSYWFKELNIPNPKDPNNPDVSESPALFKAGSTYYYLFSKATGWQTNDNSYSTATSLEGPWTYRGLITPQGTKTWSSQTTFVLPVTGTQGTTYVYMGDRWCDSYLTATTNVWQPLTVNGTSLSIPAYHPSWSIDVNTGTWRDVSDTGTSVNDATMGTGQNQFNYTGKWSHTSTANAYNNDNSYSSTANDNATISFTGTQVKLYSVIDSSEGVIGITLCDSNGNAIYPEVPADLNSQIGRKGNYLVYSSPVMANSSYRLKIRVTGFKDNKSSGITGVVDRITIKDGTTPTPTPTPPTNFINVNNTAFTFSGSNWWGNASWTGCYGNDYNGNSGNITTDYAQYTFTGTQAKVYAPKANWIGKCDIYVDGVKKVTVDGYSASGALQQLYYDTGVLSSGSHTIKIMPTNTKNSSATNVYIAVDYISYK